MLAELKKCLAECHLTGKDKISKIIMGADELYLVKRAEEELSTLQDVVLDDDFELCKIRVDKFKLSIQLLNMARYKSQLIMAEIMAERLIDNEKQRFKREQAAKQEQEETNAAIQGKANDGSGSRDPESDLQQVEVP